MVKPWLNAAVIVVDSPKEQANTIRASTRGLEVFLPTLEAHQPPLHLKKNVLEPPLL
mgnify:CR=1 FL=1